MSHSLNEIEAMAKRAARGAGFSWGVCEEIGKAACWLESHGLPGVALLADILSKPDVSDLSKLTLNILEQKWIAQDGKLNPIMTGVALNDCAERLLPEGKIELENVSHPLLLIPFAAWASLHIAGPVCLSWLDIQVITDGHRLRIFDPNSQIDSTAPTDVLCTCSTQDNVQFNEPGWRGNVDKSAWEQLGIFAHRTYAPATDESRLLGAGAGLSDND